MCRSARKAALNTICVLAVTLVLVVITGAFSLIDMPSYAADSDKAIQLVNNGAVAGIQGKQKSNVYFGNYKQSSDGNGGFKIEPVKWRVLQNENGKVFIMADKLLDARFFDINNYSRGWDLSDVRAWLNGYGDHSVDGFINKALSSDEQESVAITTVTTPINPSYGTGGGEDTQDKIFLLSLPEVIEPEYGFNSDRFVKDDARKGVFTDYSASLPAANSECVWILRTKGNSFASQVIVHGAGEIDSLSGIGIGISTDPHYYPKPIRPALKIDLGSVLFTSAAVNGKQSGDVGPDAMKVPGAFDGKDWKFTVKDADRRFRISQTEAECRINDTLTLNYTGAVTGSKEYISALISNQKGEILYYGRVAKPASAGGTVDITVPKSISTGTYDLKVFNEQYNGDMETDYASEMSNISLTVIDPIVPYVNDAGRKQKPEICKPIWGDTNDIQTLSSGWYAVLDDVRAIIEVNGKVDLILCDGATFDAAAGITIKENSSLTIWAQSMGKYKGTLDASMQELALLNYGNLAGIGFDDQGTGKLTINGGNIIAKGFGGAAGIGGKKGKPGGKVVINGGKVIAQARNSLVSTQQAIGHGGGYSNVSAGELELGKVKVSVNGGSSYVDSGDRKTGCRLTNTEILIERCSDHKFENNICKYCGAGRPLRIDDESNDLKVTLGKQLVYNGKEQTQTVTEITLNGEDITDCCDISDNVKKNAGDYELTITADKECGYEGTVKQKFTIKKVVPHFTVYANNVNDDLRVSAVRLTRSNTTVPGTLKLTETSLSYGTNTYHWVFTPSDTVNYETATGTVSITVSGHIWEFAGFEWTGNEKDGYTAAAAKYVCKNNADHKETVSKVTLTEDVIKPTCTEDGKTVYTAVVEKADSLDGEKHTESKDAKTTGKLGHDWKTVTCTAPKTCTRCNGTEGKPLGHTWIEATCTEPKTCSVCGATEGEPLRHSWEFAGFEWTGNEKDGYTADKAKYVCKNNADHKETVSKVTLTEDVIKPTCTEDGKTVYTAVVEKTDSLDGEKHTESKDAKLTDKVSHDWKAATCTEPKTCSVCGATEGEPIGHTWKEVTCTEPKTCSVCGATEGEPIGHTWKEATCTESKTCSVCGATEGEPLGHKWDDGIVTKKATAEESGVKTFTCTVCETVRTEILPVLKPDDKEADEAKEDKTLPTVNIDKTDTVGNYRKKQMKIIFPVNEKIDSYRIQYRVAGKKKWTNGWSAGKGTYIVKNLKKYSLCEFRIAGYVKLDDGTWIRSKWSKVSYRYVSSTPIKTVKGGKKSIKVTWRKDRKSNGYRVQYSLKKNLAGKKIVTVNGKSKTKYTIKKLKTGKAYYIKVRPIKKKSGKIYIGILSGTKKAKVK